MPRKSITIKLPEDLISRLKAASAATKPPHSLTVTAIIERGAELALKELSKTKRGH